jgi:hypothetical protein
VVRCTQFCCLEALGCDCALVLNKPDDGRGFGIVQISLGPLIRRWQADANSAVEKSLNARRRGGVLVWLKNFEVTPADLNAPVENYLEDPCQSQRGDSGVQAEGIGWVGQRICQFVGEAEAQYKFERGDCANVSAPIALIFDTKIMSKNVRIGNKVEWQADPINANDGRADQIGRVVVMTVEVIIHPHTIGARRLLGVGRDGCPEGLKAVVIDGMIVK